MRTRPVLLAAAAATGLAAIGTVVAQVPPPAGSQPRVQPASPGTLPATTVRPYADWTPNPPPPGYTPKQPGSGVQPTGYLQPPPGYTQNAPPGAAPKGGRLTNPVMAGPGGVKPAGGFDLPPPSMDLPGSPPRGGAPLPPPTGVAGPPAGRPLPPPSVSLDPEVMESKFAPAGSEARPPAPPVPPLTTPDTSAVSGPSTPPLPLPLPTNPGGPKPTAGPAVGGTPVPADPGSPAGPTVTQVPNTLSAPGPESPVPGTPTAPPAAAAPPPAGILPPRVTPSVTVETVCPDAVEFGQEFKYTLIVRNHGSAAVSGVRVEGEIPSAARYAGSEPPGELYGDRLVWTVGALEAGAERRIEVRVKPGEEGEVRCRATVAFTTAVDARTRVTRPRVAVALAGAEVCRAGEETVFKIKVTNSGSGPATRMVLQARLSDGLLHPQGQVIEAELAKLPPNETRTVDLKVAAARAGLQSCQITVAAEGSPDATAKASVNVVEPLLHVTQSGPGKCLVRAEPVYTIELANPGTAATDPVLLQSVLPDGFEFVQASDAGTFAPETRSVTWRLPGLAAGSTRSVSLKVRAAVAADSRLVTVAQAGPPSAGGVTTASGTTRPAGRGLEAKAETPVTAEGVAAVRFEVTDVEDPVVAGKEAVYEIRVTNQGTGPCTNVQVVAALAEGTEFVGATNGPNQAAVRAQGQQLVFDPIPTLGVKGDTVYRVRVRGSVPGDLRFRVQLTCDQLKTPVVKEESTRFYKE